MPNYGKLDHTQKMYLRFSISLHIHETVSEVKMRVYLSAYSTTTSARNICSNALALESIFENIRQKLIHFKISPLDEVFTSFFIPG